MQFTPFQTQNNRHPLTVTIVLLPIHEKVKSWLTLVVSLAEFYQLMVVVVECLLQWGSQHLVSKVAVSTSPEQDVYALDVATHAGYVQWSVHIVGDSIQVALGVNDVVVASVASFVEGVVLVDEVVVGICSISEQIMANFRSSVQPSRAV